MTIKELRTSMNLTQVQASKLTNIPLRTYKIYENDKTKENTIKYLYIENKLFTELVIPSDITEYNIYNLRGCKSLKKVTIHDSVISIGDYVFEGCSNLSTVIIGKNVEKVGQYAFGYTSITDCYSYATTTPNLSNSSGSYIYYKAFYPGVKEGAKLYVPARCGTEYKSSRWGEYFKNIIEMD